MARSSDRDRIIWILQERGRSSNRQVRSALNLSDARYDEVRQELLNEGLIEKVRGQGGGIQLSAKGLKTPGVIPIDKSAPNEKYLYAPFVKVLEAESKENEEAALAIDTNALRRQGKWSNPDVTKISIHKFPLLRTHKILVTTYELKKWGPWSIEAVFEAAAQRKFAHASYLVLEWAKGEDVVGLDELLSVCGRFGVGLLTLHPYFSSYRYVVHLEAERNAVSEDDLEEYLGYVFEKDKDALKKYEDLCSNQGI